MKSNFTDKLAPKSIKCKFVGYPKETKGYYFYIPNEHKMVVARYATFLESEYIAEKASGSSEPLVEILETITELEPEQPQVVQDTQIPRRSSRVR